MILNFLKNDIINTFITTGIIIIYLIVANLLGKSFASIYSSNKTLSTEQFNNTNRWFYYLTLGFTPIMSILVLFILKLKNIPLYNCSHKIIKIISILFFTFICVKIYVWDIYGVYFVMNEIHTPLNSAIISFFKKIDTIIPEFNFMYFDIISPFE